MQLSNAKDILLHQNAEWSRMMKEESDRQSLLRYAITLILIAYALLFVLTALFWMAISAVIPFSVLHAITVVVVQCALTVASLYFVPSILGALAPSFGGKNDSLSALKLFVFAGTPAWIGTSIGIIPLFGWLLALAGAVFGIYLFWQHVAEAMSIPAEKKVGYVVVAIITLAVIQIVIGIAGNGLAKLVAPYPVYHLGF